MSNNDDVRITIQNIDAYTLPCENYISIERKIDKVTIDVMLR
jgi:hypothetical protein